MGCRLHPRSCRGLSTSCPAPMPAATLPGKRSMPATEKCERTSEPWSPPSFASSELPGWFVPESFVQRSASVSARRAARFTDDERGLDDITYPGVVAALFQGIDNMTDRSAPELRDLHAHRRQRRHEEAGDRNVVESHQRDVLGDTQAGLAKRAERAERHGIVRREHRCRPRILGGDFLSRLVT